MKAIEAELVSSVRSLALGDEGIRPPTGFSRIVGLALAHPRDSLTQEQVLERLGLVDDEFAQRIFARCGVRRRRLTLSEEFLATTVQGRTLMIEQQLLDQAARAVEQLALDPAEIGVLVTSSLYSLGGPTLAHKLVERLEMDPAVDKYHIVGVGCASAVPLVRFAAQALSGHPGKQALVVAAESMSGILTTATEADERSKTVGSSIFGDGCAAALIEAPIDAEDRDGWQGRAALGATVVASKVHQIPDTLDAVRMQLSEHDSYLHLIRELPDVAAEGLGELVDDFLAAEGLRREAIDRWLLHPGGRRIVESLQGALELSHEQAQASFDVLAEHGNIGTPAIFYVMRRSLELSPARPGERALMVTVGPGVTVGLMLLQW